MATSISEFELFHCFVSEKLPKDGGEVPLDEAVQAFRAYQQQLDSLRREIQPAFEGSLAGESQPFDAEDLKQRVLRECRKNQRDAYN